MTPPKNLFRKEALERQGSQSPGEIFFATPLNYKIICGLCCLLTLGMILFFTQFTYSRKITASGVVAPEGGVLRISAPQAGTLSKIHVKQGDRVKAGAELFSIVDDRQGLSGESPLASVESSMRARQESLEREKWHLAEQAMQKKHSLEARAAQAANEGAALRSQWELARSKAGVAQAALLQNEQLFAQGFVSESLLRAKKTELLEAQSRVAELARALAINAGELDIANANLAEQRIQILRDESARNRSAMAIAQDLAELRARRETSVRSPVDGVVGAIPLRQGQQVAPGGFLAFINSSESSDAVVANLSLPSSALGFVNEGAPVMIRYHAFPYQKFGQHSGRVVEISPTPILPADTVEPSGRRLDGNNGAYFPAKVALDRQSVTAFGLEKKILPGMSFDATLVLESRTLAEWALEPLHTIRGRAATGAAGAP